MGNPVFTLATIGSCCVDNDAAAVEANTAVCAVCCCRAFFAGTDCSCRIWCRTEMGVLEDDGVPEGVPPTLLLICGIERKCWHRIHR